MIKKLGALVVLLFVSAVSFAEEKVEFYFFLRSYLVLFFKFFDYFC